MNHTYMYDAKLLRVVDADTFDALVDLGMYTHKEVRLRLRDVDTAEIYGVSSDTEEYEQGQKQKRFVEAWVNEGRQVNGEFPFIIRTYKDDRGKYGRYLTRVWRRDEEVPLHRRLLDRFEEVEEIN